MLDRTAGPPRKPVFAATNSNPASNTSTSSSAAWLTPGDRPRLPMMLPNTTAFSVWPSTGAARHSRYSRMMPPAVNASEVAM